MRRTYTVTYKDKDSVTDEYDMKLVVKVDKLSKTIDILQDYYEIISIS